AARQNDRPARGSAPAAQDPRPRAGRRLRRFDCPLIPAGSLTAIKSTTRQENTTMIFTAAIQNPTTPECLCQAFDWLFPKTLFNPGDETWTKMPPMVAADLDDAVEYLTELALECRRPIATNVPTLAERLQRAGVQVVDFATAWRWH